MALNANDQLGGDSLREARRARGFSQQRLAELAGCSMSYVNLLERGFTPTDSNVLPRLWQALNDDAPAGGERVEKPGRADAQATQ